MSKTSYDGMEALGRLDPLVGVKGFSIDGDVYVRDLLQIPAFDPSEIAAAYVGDPYSLEGFIEKVQVYWYQLRASVVSVLNPDCSTDEARKAFRILHDQWFNPWAYFLAHKEMESGKPAVPLWLEIATEAILRHSPRELRGTASAIEFRVEQSYEITLLASIGPPERIVVPALLRSFLVTYNLGLLGVLDLIPESISDLPALAETFLEFFFPYYLFMFKYIRLTHLPQILVFSDDTVRLAKRLAYYQMLFLILHELSHLALRGESPRIEPSSVLPSYLRHAVSSVAGHLVREVECDWVAASCLIWGWPEQELDLMLVAIDFLMKTYTAMYETRRRVEAISGKPGVLEINPFKVRWESLVCVPSKRPASGNLRALGALADALVAEYTEVIKSIDEGSILAWIDFFTTVDNDEAFLSSLYDQRRR